MCKISNTNLGIRKLDFLTYRGKMAAFLTDGREVIVPLSMFPEIKQMSKTRRNEWMILDEQFFTFASMSKVYAVTDLLKV